MRRQCRDGQVDPLDAQTGQTNDEAQKGGNETREWQCDVERQPARRQPRDGITPHTHEGAMAQGDQTRVASRQVQTQCGNDMDAHNASHGQRIVAAPQRHGEQAQCEGQHPATRGG